MMTRSRQTTEVNNKTTSSGDGALNSQSSDEIVHDMAVQKIKDTIKNIQEDTIRCMNEQLNSLVAEMVKKIEQSAFRNGDLNRLFEPTSANQHDKQRIRNDELILPIRQFVPRSSLLMDLFEVKHIRSIYHMFIAVLIISFMNSGLSDALNGNEIRLGLRYIPVGFGKLQQALFIWMFMLMATLLAYPLFCLWVKGRTALVQNKRAWDVACLSGFICYLAAFIYYSLRYRDYDMPIGSSAIVLLEQTRFIMKMHAFVRSNVPVVIYETKPLPGFSHFLYFLFAPTLIYRDVYPRTNVIQWSFVMARLLEVIGAVFMISFIVEHYFVPEFMDFGIKAQSWGTVIGSIFRTILPASMVMLCGFFLLLHSWMNAWAEGLRFADRLFYRDWWNAQSFSAFYRTWNIVVHDYLFTYIYSDVHQLLIKSKYRRVLATFAVFTLSALVHEFIIGFMLGFCYPVLFIQFFGLGMALAFVKSSTSNSVIGRCGNVFIWWSLSCGIGIQISFYTMEMVARWNCPRSHDQFSGGWNQYFVPRSWTCNGLVD